jgi:hypothetical protein
VIGCAIAVQERRIRYLGPCNSTATTTETFTIKNNGAHNWTGYNAVEDAEDDDWMTVSYTSSPVVQFATGTVTATIDWSQVPAPGNQKSKIKFGASCDSGSTFVYDTPVGTGAQAGDETVNVVDTTPAAVKLIYKGDQNPSNNNSAGIGYKFFLWSGIDQGTIVTESGVGPDKASDGLAYYLNDTSSAKTKWQSVKNDDTPAYTINRYVGSTAMSRLKVTSTSGTNLQYDFGIQHQASISAYCYWGGAANLIMDTRGNSATVSGDANYHVIRVTSRDTNVTGQGIVVNYYLDENPSPVLTITNASGSADGTVDGIAFGAASTAQSKETYFDWISGTNAGAFAPGDEVACIGSLVPGSNCNLPKVDIDGDGDVDMDDFGELQKCYTGDKITFNGGIGFSLSQECACLDNDHDQDIDAGDFNHFVNCETGASIPWVSSGPCPN